MSDQVGECMDCRFWERPVVGERFGACAVLSEARIDGRTILFHGPPSPARAAFDEPVCTDMEFGCRWFEPREA